MDSRSATSTARCTSATSEVAASVTCSITSSLSHTTGSAPRRFLTISDYAELMEARKSGTGSVMWWPCADDLARRQPVLDTHQVVLENETSNDVGTYSTDGSELTPSHLTEGSELPSSASAAAFAAAHATVDGEGILSEMQRLRQENLRLVAEMDKLRKSKGESSEASTECSTKICTPSSLFNAALNCDDGLYSDEMTSCSHMDVVDQSTAGANSNPKKSTPGGKMREWIRAQATKKNDAFKKDRGLLSCAPKPSRAPFASSVSQLFGRPDPGLELVWDPQVGERLEAVIKLTLRGSEAMQSPEIQKLPRGVVCRIEELGQENKNRVKISLDDGTAGWISILDKKVQRPLLGRRKSVVLSDSDGEGVE